MTSESGKAWGEWQYRPSCLCTTADATTAVIDCPQHGSPGYGPEAFIPEGPGFDYDAPVVSVPGAEDKEG